MKLRKSDYYTDVPTTFGRWRWNGNWCVLSRLKATRWNECDFDQDKRARIKRFAEKLMALRIKTQPFEMPGTRRAYVEFGGEWFPAEQVIFVAEETGATRFGRFVSPKSGTPTLFLLGRKGRGLVAAMSFEYVAECGGAKGIRRIKWADFH